MLCCSLLASLLLAVLFITLAGKSAGAQTPFPDHPKIDPGLQSVLVKSRPADILDVIVYMNDAVDFSLLELQGNKTQNRRTVVQSLQQTALESQVELKAQLESYQSDGSVESYRSLWIINAIHMKADSAAIGQIAARNDVSRVTLNETYRFVEPGEIFTTALSVDLPWGLERIRSNHAIHGLGVDGAGVTVAIMDTGVDWSHPALKTNYRGYREEGAAQHVGNWYDAVEGAPTPLDPNGHGTHVAGTAVGQEGIGVAPGANWIAVRIFNEYGFGSVADIHAAFQWLLAPDGNPELSPDVVNNSWSGNPGMTDFIPDVAALKAAGIVPLFAAGNSGPDVGTINAPANYPDTIAVGAADDLNLIAWFSSRGPSGLTREVKPTLAAPGTRILSSLPDNQYGYFNGTSMATPHVTGIYALLLSVDPTLLEKELTALVTSNAVPLGIDQPNNDFGWGLADAYAAVADVAIGGTLQGTVHSDGATVPDAVITVTNQSGRSLPFQSDEDGKFKAYLLPGKYDITVANFGFYTYNGSEIIIEADELTDYDVDLSRLPHGLIFGQLRDSSSIEPLTGTVRVGGTPVTVNTDDEGYYQLQLPAGRYSVAAIRDGFKISRFTMNITSNSIAEHDFILEPTFKTLLVDGGSWLYDSQIDYFVDALEQNDFAHTLISIRNPFTDVPTAQELGLYDAVIWSSPTDSPGFVGAGEALSEYLDDGGRFLVSGQNVAWLDDMGSFSEPWMYRQLRSAFAGKAEEPFSLVGAEATPFEGMNFELNGLDSAGNQDAPDLSKPLRKSLTEVAFSYPNGQAGALYAHRCAPFHIVYLGFGLEGVSGAANRAELIARSLDFFTEPDADFGLRYTPAYVDDFVPPSGKRSYEVEILNLGETLTDTFELSIENASWPTSLVTQTLTLGPCESGRTIINVDIPAELPLDTTERFELLARSTNYPGYSEAIPVDLKTPGHILLVDDDRWYDQAATFRAALDGAGYSYDFWEVGPLSIGRGSPPSDLLNAYAMVLWYTGYDWFEPITSAESETLLAYLSQGGRLFLTSQDYLYYHEVDLLTRDYFGVQQYVESIEPTRVYGNEALGFGADLAGPLPLNYGLYKNFSDGMVLVPDASALFWHNRGYAAGAAHSGNGWRTAFLSYPFEALPDDVQPMAMSQIVGWLSDFGDSTFEVDHRSGKNYAESTSTRTFTITLRNFDYAASNHVVLTNTVPNELEINETSITGNAHYNPSTRQVTWNGQRDGGESHEIVYQASPNPSLPAGLRIDNPAIIYYERHNLKVNRTASYWIEAPDLSKTDLVVSPALPPPNHPVTVFTSLRNTGLATAVFSATLFLPEPMEPITETLEADTGTAVMKGNMVQWQGEIGVAKTAHVSVQITTPLNPQTTRYPLSILVEDSVTAPVFRQLLLDVVPNQIHFPLVTFKEY